MKYRSDLPPTYVCSVDEPRPESRLRGEVREELSLSRNLTVLSLPSGMLMMSEASEDISSKIYDVDCLLF